MTGVSRKALITGGAGFIGSHLTELLLADGWEVWALDDLSTGSLDERRAPPRPRDFHLVVDSVLSPRGRERARAQVRRRLPPGRRGRRAADRRAAGAHARHEPAGHRDRARVLQPLRQAGVDRVHSRGLRRSPRAAPLAEDRSPRLRADDAAPLGVRRLEGDGRVPGARLPPRARARLRHRPALQHRRPAPERPVRDGHPPFVERRSPGEPLEIHGDGTQTRCFCHVRTRSAR